MRAFSLFMVATVALLGLPGFALESRPRVVISIDLGKQKVTVFKYEPGRPKPLAFETPSLAVVPGSMRTGRFAGRLPTLLVRAERSATRLDHAILFDGQHALRSSRHFQEMSTHPIAGSVIVPGEYGGLIATAVQSAGGKATVIVHE